MFRGRGLSSEYYELSTLSPSSGQRQKAFALVLLMICGCVLALPLSATHIPRFEALILIVDTALILLSCAVAFVLFAQFMSTGSKAVLALACGFLLVTLTTLPQLLRVSRGAFIDPRLHFITDLALPVAVIAYAMLRRGESAATVVQRSIPADTRCRDDRHRRGTGHLAGRSG